MFQLPVPPIKELKIKRSFLLTLLLIFVPLNLIHQANGAQGNLGLSLQILQGESSKTGLENNTRLWFVIEPGQMKSRTILVRSTATISERISLSVGAVKRVNGKSQLDLDGKSSIEPWARFSVNDFVLEPNETKEVQIIFEIPADENVNSYSGMLLVKASGLTNKLNQDDYSVPGAAQIAAPIFLGVGTEDEFITQFEIKDVFGVNTTEGKALRVEIKNSGKTPVSIIGEVQVTGVTFQTETLGPFNYQTETIAPGESKFADALVGEQIIEGKWRIYITASQGGITETREFEKNITFTGSNSLVLNIVRVAVGVISLLLLLWVYRTFRPRTTRGQSPIIDNKVTLPEQTKALIDELEAKTAALEALMAKQAVTKKVVKKAAVKKVTVKKVAAKKAAVKKATVKKKQS